MVSELAAFAICSSKPKSMRWPAIIFVDEIDAVGRQRGAGLGGGHDEREQTLNQILSEMDGFAGNDSVIVMAATRTAPMCSIQHSCVLVVSTATLLWDVRLKRVDWRCSRFTLATFRSITMSISSALAAVTIGLTGADIRNLVNEAALWAARNNKTRVGGFDFDYARDKVLMGAKREEVLSDSEKGKDRLSRSWSHIGCVVPQRRLTESIKSRSFLAVVRLGVTQIVPTEDRVSGETRTSRSISCLYGW